MPQVSFREVQNRFGHIDGRVVSAQSRLDERGLLVDANLAVRFYAWWEHPRFIELSGRGAAWSVETPEGAERDMTIEAVSPVMCSLHTGGDATELVFTTDDPILWRFEDVGQIVCNSDFDRQAFFEGVSRRGPRSVDFAAIARYVPPYAFHKAPYSLGYFPQTLFALVKAELEELGVDIHIAREPQVRRPLVALLVDTNVLVAEDFLVDLPELEHRPEWIKSRGRFSRG